MNIQKIKINKLFTILLSIIFVFGFLMFFTLTNTKNNVFAESSVECQTFLPLSELENYNLSSPLDIYTDSEITAIIQGDNTSQTLIVYSENGGFTQKSGFSSLKKISRIEDDLILDDQNIIYKLPIDSLNSDPSALLCNSQSIGCTTFDVYQNTLAITTGSKIIIYSVENGVATKINEKTDAAITDSAIACNSKGIYYTTNDEICYRSFENFENSRSEIQSITPSKMIANEEKLFYVLGGDIYVLNIISGLSEKFVKPQSQFELGSYSSAKSISLNGDNLLVTDSTGNSIQEFSVNGNNLIFTGFAIAQNKTAYNRISKNAIDIERYNNKIAILDQNKLTVVLDNATDYNPENFENLFVSDAPSVFALGDDSILFGKNNELCSYEFKTKTSTVIYTNTDSFTDICYMSGKYYALSNDGTNTTVFTVLESDFSVSKETFNDILYVLIDIDYLGNTYLATENKIFKNEQEYCDNNSFTKIKSDLSNTLFATDGTKLYHFTNSSWINCNISENNVISFALSFDKNALYFISDNEFIYQTEKLSNLAINKIQVSDGFTLNGKNSDFSKLTYYTVREGANIYKVDTNQDKFNFIELNRLDDEYILIDTIQVGSNLSFYSLIGKSGIVLVNTQDCTLLNKEIKNAPEKVYITTTVHAYFYPIMTVEEQFRTTDNGEEIFIPKNTQIKTNGITTFNNTDFYLAEVAIGENIYLCYIPCSFTSLTLSTQINSVVFTIRTARETNVYNDKNLTLKIGALTNNQEIRLYSIENGIATIEYFNGEWIKGYIGSNYIMDTPNSAVRNSLIILACFTCICGSATYFILRRKKNS